MKEAAGMRSPRRWIIDRVHLGEGDLLHVLFRTWVPGSEIGDRPCKECGEAFLPESTKAIFCSAACRQKDYRRRHQGLPSA